SSRVNSAPCEAQRMSARSGVRNRSGLKLSGCPACGQVFTYAATPWVVRTRKPRSGQSPSPTAKPLAPVASSSANEPSTRVTSISRDDVMVPARQPHQQEQSRHAQQRGVQEEVAVAQRIDHE